MDVDATSYLSPPPDSDPETGIELVPLCAIVGICTHDFWLTSDANYCQGSQVWQELVNVKPSCTLEELDPQPARSDFKTVI
jgi:hypothetical protein